jgi:hypothetical protein
VKKYVKGERNIELVSPFGSHFASKERFYNFLERFE